MFNDLALRKAALRSVEAVHPQMMPDDALRNYLLLSQSPTPTSTEIDKTIDCLLRNDYIASFRDELDSQTIRYVITQKGMAYLATHR